MGVDENIVTADVIVELEVTINKKGVQCGNDLFESSQDAIALYQKLGFKPKKRYMIKQWD